MARYLGPQCRLCRAEGIKLFLKGERCNTGKCPIKKRRGKPGKGPRARMKKTLRLRNSAARKTEGEKNLRHAGETV
ncbi:hypothetical protein ES705_35906 [subsurface metagenome]